MKEPRGSVTTQAADQRYAFKRQPRSRTRLFQILGTSQGAP